MGNYHRTVEVKDHQFAHRTFLLVENTKMF